MGGLISLTGFDERTPLKVGPGIADIFSGFLLSFGLLASILKSRTSGQAQYVEVAMYDAIVSMCEERYINMILIKLFLNQRVMATHCWHHLGFIMLKMGLLLLNRGRYLLERSKKIIDCQDLLNDLNYGTIALRAKNRNELNKQINLWTKKFSKNELVNLLGGKFPLVQ